MEAMEKKGVHVAHIQDMDEGETASVRTLGDLINGFPIKCLHQGSTLSP